MEKGYMQETLDSIYNRFSEQPAGNANFERIK
jgi:hypothetical protein